MYFSVHWDFFEAKSQDTTINQSYIKLAKHVRMFFFASIANLFQHRS
jgi:hypothetical protein